VSMSVVGMSEALMKMCRLGVGDDGDDDKIFCRVWMWTFNLMRGHL
jgi:hypothetical protein